MAQLEHINEIEKRLWSSADNLRANSNYASNEYFLPVMGLIFLRHAYINYNKSKRGHSKTIYEGVCSCRNYLTFLEAANEGLYPDRIKPRL